MKTHGVAQHGHVTHGIQENQVISAIKFLGEIGEYLDQIRAALLLAAELLAQVMHDDFGVVVADNVVVRFFEQGVSQFGVIG